MKLVRLPRTIVFWVFMLLTPAPMSIAAAQSAGPVDTDELLATIVLVPDLGAADRRAVILRRQYGNPENVVLVSETTNAKELARAIGALVKSLATQGHHVAHDSRAYVLAESGAPRTYANEARARADLARLSQAAVYDIDGVGPGRAITVRLAPRAGTPK